LEGGVPEVKTKALARLWRAMDDDGRRHYSNQPVDTAGTGLDGPFANEYRALFWGLETTQFDKASTKVTQRVPPHKYIAVRANVRCSPRLSSTPSQFVAEMQSRAGAVGVAGPQEAAALGAVAREPR
jgi:hypothetical protein